MLYRNKKKNDINEGKWIGVGGHIEKDETPEDALLREVKEETGYDVVSFMKRGVVYFVNNDFKEAMHLYVITDVAGDLTECDEGELKYFSINRINQLPMWEGDHIFLNRLLKDDKYFELTLTYDGDKLLSYRFE